MLYSGMSIRSQPLPSREDVVALSTHEEHLQVSSIISKDYSPLTTPQLLHRFKATTLSHSLFHQPPNLLFVTPTMTKSTSNCQRKKKVSSSEHVELKLHVQKVVRSTVHHCGGQKAGGKGSCVQRNGICVRHETYCKACKRKYMTHQECMCKSREEKAALVEKRGR